MMLSSFDRRKVDNTDDELFYQQPRYVHHLGNSFRKKLTALYSEFLKPHHVILDLMSSWVSHLPENIKYKRVIGHGLNSSELKSNKRFDHFWVQDLNKKNDQSLPIEESSIDIGLIVAGWQYLQYPEYVSRELSRIIKSNGLLIIAFTNRAFWTKSPNIWTYSSEDERIEYVRNVISTNGWRVHKILKEKTYDHKLLGLITSPGDPFYSLVAKNNKSNN